MTQATPLVAPAVPVPPPRTGRYTSGAGDHTGFMPA